MNVNRIHKIAFDFHFFLCYKFYGVKIDKHLMMVWEGVAEVAWIHLKP
jgi:hypothetical protein